MYYSRYVDCELSATTGDLCKKSAMSSAAASLRVICPPCVRIYMTSLTCKDILYNMNPLSLKITDGKSWEASTVE